MAIHAEANQILAKLYFSVLTSRMMTAVKSQLVSCAEKTQLLPLAE
jgi:hypothetical protein